MSNTLRITTNGERLRNLLSLRIKEHDRNILRVSAALEIARGDLERASAETRDRFERAQGRVVGNFGGLGHDHASVGMTEQFSAKNQIDKLENGVAVFHYQRAQLVWLSEQFDPDRAYELDANDLVVIGIGTAEPRLRYGLDLDL